MLVAPWILVPLLSGAPLEASAAPARRTPPVVFDGKHHRVDKLPDEMLDGPKAILEQWSPLAEEDELYFALSDDQAIVFVSPNKPQLKKRLELIEDAQARTEVLLYGAKEAKARAKARAKGIVPEIDGRRGPLELPADSIVDHRSNTITIFEFENPGQVKTVLARLAFEHEYLKSWLATINERTGFTFEYPLVGGWIGTSEQEEWDPDAELVNRVAQLLLLREYGTMPYWLRMGVAWNVEHEVMGGLWCFPYRDEFVFTYEHTSWPNEIQNLFEDRDDAPLEATEFMEWPLRTWDGEKARISFGLLHFLAAHHADELPLLFDAYREAFALGQTEVDEDGVWRRKPDYMLPMEEQVRLLVENSRKDLFPQATAYFQKKFKYKPR